LLPGPRHHRLRFVISGCGRTPAPPAHLQRAALAVVASASDRCADQDMRTPEVIEVLAFLEGQLLRPAVSGRFCAALDIPDPLARVAAVQFALKGGEGRGGGRDWWPCRTGTIGVCRKLKIFGKSNTLRWCDSGAHRGPGPDVHGGAPTLCSLAPTRLSSGNGNENGCQDML
jgi:hypothetical protein